MNGAHSDLMVHDFNSLAYAWDSSPVSYSSRTYPIVDVPICFAINFSPHIAFIILGKPARFGLQF